MRRRDTPRPLPRTSTLPHRSTQGQAARPAQSSKAAKIPRACRHLFARLLLRFALRVERRLPAGIAEAVTQTDDDRAGFSHWRGFDGVFRTADQGPPHARRVLRTFRRTVTLPVVTLPTRGRVASFRTLQVQVVAKRRPSCRGVHAESFNPPPAAAPPRYGLGAPGPSRRARAESPRRRCARGGTTPREAAAPGPSRRGPSSGPFPLR